MSPIDTQTMPSAVKILDITKQVHNKNQWSPTKPLPDMTSLAALPPNHIKMAIEVLSLRGLQDITFYFEDLGRKAKGVEILQLLSEQKLNPTQIALALYYLLTLVQNGLTPSREDNMVHLNFSQLKSALSSSALAGALYAKIKDGKPDKLFMAPKMPPAVAPYLLHTSAGIETQAPSTPAAAQTNKIIQPKAFLIAVLEGYASAADIVRASDILFAKGEDQ